MKDDNTIIPEYWELLNFSKLPLHGKSKRVIGEGLFKRIRNRLHLTQDEFPDKLIHDILKFSNRVYIDYIFDNPEGLQLNAGEDLFGVLAISKHLPKEMRDDKFEKIEDIMNFSFKRSHSKKIILKRYNTDVNRRLDKQKLKVGEKIPKINLHTYMYTYRMMWFNHRNCKIKKAIGFEFEPLRKDKDRMYEVIMQGRDYYELQFDHFYRNKIKPYN